jgi:hypothetical protein
MDRSFEARPGGASIRSPRQSALYRLVRRRHDLMTEGLKLYRPLPHLAAFHQCTSRWRLVDGGNRASKTESCAYEAALAFTGSDPHDKYVRRGGNALIIGKEEDDIARLWRALTEPTFKVIRDEHTRQWRSVRPDPEDPLHLDPYDLAYREQWRDAPPFLTPRNYDPPAWTDARRQVPRRVYFPVTDWTVWLRSSKGDAPQGDHYDFGWIDEQLDDEEFYRELNRGLVAIYGLGIPDRHAPKGIWSATAQVANIQLTELREAAKAGSQEVSAFFTNIELNPYVSDADKAAWKESLTEEEVEYRYEGKHAVEGKRVYHLYQPQGIHTYQPFAIPSDWSVYVVLDPGRDHCGTLFLAVDPEGKHAWVYDGFDLRQSHRFGWAAEVKKRQRATRFEAFLCDTKAGQQHGMGNDKTYAEQYWEALEQQGDSLLPVLRGSAKGMAGFIPGSPNVEGREEALIGWMTVRGFGPFAGTPRLQVARGQLPALDRQIRHARTDPDRPNKRYQKKDARVCDLLTCLEYLAAYDPQYRKPTPILSPRSRPPVEPAELLQQKRSRQRRRRAMLMR